MGKGMRAGKRPSGGGGMQKQLQQMQATEIEIEETQEEAEEAKEYPEQEIGM